MLTNAKNYTIELITKKDKNETLNFLRNHFFRDEPLCQFLGLESTPDNPNIELDEFSLDGFDNDWGFKAIDETGQMIGLSLSMVIKRGIGEDFNVTPENNFFKIKNLLDHMIKKIDIWTNNPDFKKGIQINILSVDKNHGGQGIGKELVKKVRQQAKDQNFDFILVECSSHFSALVMKKLGFKLIYSLPYDEYKSSEQEVIFKPEAPHLKATVWVDKL